MVMTNYAGLKMEKGEFQKGEILNKHNLRPTTNIDDTPDIFVAKILLTHKILLHILPP